MNELAHIATQLDAVDDRLTELRSDLNRARRRVSLARCTIANADRYSTQAWNAGVELQAAQYAEARAEQSITEMESKRDRLISHTQNLQTYSSAGPR